jgi:hypothetical protein
MKSILGKTTNWRTRTVIGAGILLQLLVGSVGAASAQDLFNNTNTAGVGNRPSAATVFSLGSAANIRELQTYHWNFGRGALPGSIALRAQNGQTYGPFAATASSGFQGAPNVNWTARVNVTLPAGTYMILDSDPATWSQNLQSRGQGFAIVRGVAVSIPVSRPPVLQRPAPQAPSCQVSPVSIRNLQYLDYTPYATLSPTTVAPGGFIRIATQCLPFDGQVIVTLQDVTRGNGFGVTAFRLTNVSVNGNVVTAQVPNLPLFRNRSYHVGLFVFGNPWKTANPGVVTVQ